MIDSKEGVVEECELKYVLKRMVVPINRYQSVSTIKRNVRESGYMVDSVRLELILMELYCRGYVIYSGCNAVGHAFVVSEDGREWITEDVKLQE